MNKIQIEYDGSMKQKQVTKKVKAKGSTKGYMTERQMVPVKDPKCWEVITIENSILYSPGQRLTKKQVEQLCRSTRFEVVIGTTGQYTPNRSRY